MFKNFFKVILRDLSKDKLYTIISVAGLSAGIAVSIMIIAISFTFLSKDKFHQIRLSRLNMNKISTQIPLIEQMTSDFFI